MSYDSNGNSTTPVPLGFDLMPALNEGDERCSLSDLLSWRDDGLSDTELWAVCRECCLALSAVQHSPDMFQALCITPDTLAFDATGAVCLLDLCDLESNMVYLAPEFDTLGNSFKAHMFSLGMTLLYAAEYNASSSKSTLDSDLNVVIHNMTREDFDSRCPLSDVLNACDRAMLSRKVNSEDICRNLIQTLHSVPSSNLSSTLHLASQSTSPCLQSADSNDSLALPPAEFMDEDPKQKTRIEKKTAKPSRHGDLTLVEFGDFDDTPRNSLLISVNDICAELKRGLNEKEAWALCHQAVRALKPINDDYPAYICLDTVMIDATNGNVSFIPIPSGRELKITYLAPELQRHAIVTKKTCLYGVGALMWAATDYGDSKGQATLSSQLEMLLIIMTQNEAEARPTTKEIEEICEDQEKIAMFKSKETCQKLAKRALDAKNKRDRPSSPLPDLTPREQVFQEIRNGKYKLRKTSKPKELSHLEIFLNDKELMQGLQKVTNHGSRAPAFTPIEVTRNLIGSQKFESPKTHFKPIVLKQHKQVAKIASRKLSRASTSSNEDVTQSTPEGILRTRNSDVSQPFPYQVQLQHDPQTGFYKLIPVTVPQRPSSHPLLVSPAPNSVGGEVTVKGSTDDLVRAARQEKKKQRPKSSSGSNPSAQIKTFDINFNGETSKSDPSLEILEETKQAHKLRRRRGDHCFSPDLPLSPASSPSWSKDSGVSGINLKNCGDPALLERLLDSENHKQNRRLQQVIRLVKEEFAFDGYIDNGIEDVQVAEYIMSLGGLKWDTFVSAISEKFFDLFWEEGLLVSLFECVNGHKPQESPSDTPQQDIKEIGVPLKSNEKKSKPPKRNKVCASPWKEPPSSDGESCKPKTPEALLGGATVGSGSERKAFEGKLKDSRENLSESQEALSSSEDTKGRKVILVKSSSIEDGDDDEDERPRSPPPPRPSYSPGSADDFPMMRSHKVSFSAEDPEEFSFDSDEEPLNHLTIIRNSKSIWGDVHQIAKLRDSEKAKKDSPRDERRISHVICSSTDNIDIAVDVMPDNCWPRVQGSTVVYHWVELRGNTNAELQGFVVDMENSNKETIEMTMCDIDQEHSIEERNRRRTFTYYRKLLAATKKGKLSSEQRGMINRVIQELAENKDRLEFLVLARKHLETMYSECYGIDPSVLLALINCSPEEPMLLSMADANPHLQLQIDRDGRRILQAASSKGLMASLFAKGAISTGFIHQFLYGFRYFIAPLELLNFICDKYAASSQSLAPAVGMPAKVKVRAIDLLQAWLEGYFTIDFRNSKGMLQTLKAFLRSRDEDDCLKKVRVAFDRCNKGQNQELVPSCESPSLKLFQNGAAPNQQKSEAMVEGEMEWENFQYCLALGNKWPKTGTPIVTQSLPRYRSRGDSNPTGRTRISDTFSISDYSPQHLAEQLTLMEQDLFSLAHPVHYLNTRAQGISVHLAHPLLSRTQSISMLNSNSGEENCRGNLFVGSHHLDDIIQQLIEQAQSIAFWVSAEVLSCNSAKEQVNVITKFIATAKICREIRNFASALSIVDGLENLLVRQLPSWKGIPTRTGLTLEELSAFKLRVKGDAGCLTEDPWWQHRPTIPSILFFLVHLQQMEIGSFTLVNGMVKWTKIRRISNQVDLIRMFKQRSYSFDVDIDLQGSIKERIRQFGQHDLQVLAAQHQTNYRKSCLAGSSSRSSGFSGTFRRLREKFNRQSDS